MGNLFQCLTTLWLKNFLLVSNLNLPCLILKPFPLSYHYQPIQAVVNQGTAIWCPAAYQEEGHNPVFSVLKKTN